MAAAPERPAAPDPAFADELERAQGGDTDALDRIVRRVLPQLGRRAHGLLGPWLAGQVGGSDIVQNALVEVVRDIASFRGTTEAAFVAWLNRIVDRAARAEKRRLTAKKRRPPSDPSGLRELAVAILPQPSTPSGDMREAEFAATCEAAFAELTIDQRLALTGVLIEQRPVAEVAAWLGRTPDALHALLGRARARLALRLQQLGAYRRSDA